MDDVAVTDAAQSITFTSTPPTAPVVGEQYQASATGGGSGNPVLIIVDADSAAVCSISDTGLVTFTGIGICRLDATQVGTAPWLRAPTVGQRIKVSKAPQLVAFTISPAAAHALPGQTYILSATGGDSPNPIAFTTTAKSSSVCAVTNDGPGAGTLTTTAAGKCVITARQAGNSNYKAGIATQTVIVHRT